MGSPAMYLEIYTHTHRQTDRWVKPPDRPTDRTTDSRSICRVGSAGDHLLCI